MSFLHGTSGPPDVEVLRSRGDVSGLIETLAARGDVAVCTAALQALVEIGHAREAVEVLKETTAVWAIRPLIALLTNTDAHVRQGAVEALGRIGPPAVEPLVVALGDEGYREVRQAVARALGQIGDARAVESLRAARKFGQRDLRAAAAEVLAQLGGQSDERRARSQADAEFLHRLREEALHHKQRRASLVLQKLTFVVALFGVVVLRTPATLGTPVSLLDDFYWLLYALPFVALAYDVYICAEDYKVKRIGTFFRTSRHMAPCEREWEVYVNDHRETLTAWAGAFLTGMTIAVPALVLPFVLGKQMGVWFYAWLISSVLLPIFLLGYYQFVLLRRLVPSPAKEAVSTARNASSHS
jgi:hypothetical protein